MAFYTGGFIGEKISTQMGAVTGYIPAAVAIDNEELARQKVAATDLSGLKTVTLASDQAFSQGAKLDKEVTLKL